MPKKMPLGQLLMSIAAMRGAIGNLIRERITFSDPVYSGDLFLNPFNWVANSSVNISVKANSETELTKIQSSTGHYNNTTSNYPKTHNADSISIIWYLASFGTLVLFFLLISFSEVCCKKSFAIKPEEEPEVLPPPYDLFAPPTYDSLFSGKKVKSVKSRKKGKCEVFVIHVFGDKNKSLVNDSETMPRHNTIIAHR